MNHELWDKYFDMSDPTLTPEQRLQQLHERTDIPSEDELYVGRTMYNSMFKKASPLAGAVPAVTGVHVECSRAVLLNLLASMQNNDLIQWRLESVMDANILNPDATTPKWTIRIITWGKDQEAAETLGDVLLMTFILDNPNIPTDQKFDRWHPAIN